MPALNSPHPAFYFKRGHARAPPATRTSWPYEKLPSGRRRALRRVAPHRPSRCDRAPVSTGQFGSTARVVGIFAPDRSAGRVRV